MIMVFRHGDKELIPNIMKEAQNASTYDIVHGNKKYFFENATQATDISFALATLRILYKEGSPPYDLCCLFAKFTKADVDKEHHFILQNDLSMHKVSFYPNELGLAYESPKYSSSFCVSYPDEPYVLDTAQDFFDYLLS